MFQFLSQQKDPNCTVRRQFQMNRILKKNKHIKQERGGRSKFICTFNLKTGLTLLPT